MKKKILIGVVAVAVVFTGISFTLRHIIRNPAAPKIEPGKPIIACLGDSITYGTGVFLTRGSESYPAFLQQEVGDAYQVLNYGLSGRTMQDSGDYPYRAEPFYQKALSAEAEIYILMLGTNDTKEQNWNAEGYERDLLDTVKTIQSLANHPTVILMQPPRCFPGKSDNEKPYGIDNELIRTQVYESIAHVAEETGAGLIDLYSLTKDHPEWFPDKVHANAEGNSNIAERIYSYLLLDETSSIK